MSMFGCLMIFLKYCDRIANSVDIDQAASGSVLFAQDSLFKAKVLQMSIHKKLIMGKIGYLDDSTEVPRQMFL